MRFDDANGRPWLLTWVHLDELVLPGAPAIRLVLFGPRVLHPGSSADD